MGRLADKHPWRPEVEAADEVEKELDIAEEVLKDITALVVSRMRSNVSMGPDGVGAKMLQRIVEEAPGALSGFVRRALRNDLN